MRSLAHIGIVVILGACSDPPSPAPIPDDAAARFAAVVCAGQRTCNCGLFTDDEACEAYVVSLFETNKSRMRGFDEDCFESLLVDGGLESCLLVDDHVAAFPDQCKAMYGNVPVGEPCGRRTILNDLGPEFPCVQGAYCNTRTGLCSSEVAPAPSERPAGFPCDDRLENNCGYGATYCHGDQCRLRPEDGEACTHERACVPGSYCRGFYQDGEGICTLALDMGEACDLGDLHPCKAAAEGFIWCNPATLTCDGIEPYMCASMKEYLREIW